MKRKLIFTLLAVFTMLGSLTAQQAGDVIIVGSKQYVLKGTNLIPNPGFEDGYTGWVDGTPGKAQLTDTNFSLATDGAFEGSTYLVGKTNQGLATAGAIGTGWPIEPGKSYYFCYYVKFLNASTAAGKNTYMRVSLTNDLTATSSPDEASTPGVVVLINPTKIDGGGVWTKNEVGFTNSTNNTYIVARFRWLANLYGFDNFALFEATESDVMPDQTLISTVQMLCDKAESIYDSTKPGAQALKDAFDTGRALVAAASGVDVPAQNAALAKAIDTLKQTIADYAEANVSYALDYTFLVKNPDLETTHEGWTSTTLATNQGFATSKTLLDGSAHFWENWNSTLFTGQMFQTVEGLPNGIYTLKAAAFDDKQTGNVFLYATDADPQMTPVTTNNMAYYSVNFVVTNNSAEFGLYIINDGTTWVGLDNVTLTYWGTPLNALKAMETEAQLLTGPMEASVATELAAAIAQGQTAINSGSNTGVDDAVSRLSAAMDAANQSIAMYAPLKTAIDAANANKATYATYPGYTGFIDVLTSIEQNCMSGTYPTAADIQQAITDLRNAENACKQTNPYTPADLTVFIQNPSFEVGGFAGWIQNGMATQTNTSFAPNKDGTTYVEKWISNDGVTGVPDVSVQQDLTGLPNGNYTLIASAQNVRQGTPNQPQPGGYLFAGLSNETEVGDRGDYSVDFDITDADNGTITIGFFTASSTANWVACDNFRLIRNTGGLGVKTVNPDGLTAYGITGAIVVKSNAAVKVNVYSVVGQRIRSTVVAGGETHIPVPAGLYIVNGSKVIVR